MGWGLATLPLDRYETAQSLQGYINPRSFLVWHTFIFSDVEKLKNRIFSSFFNVKAIYLEGWLSKSYEILLLCKKKFKIVMAQKSS